MSISRDWRMVYELHHCAIRILAVKRPRAIAVSFGCSHDVDMMLNTVVVPEVNLRRITQENADVIQASPVGRCSFSGSMECQVV